MVRMVRTVATLALLFYGALWLALLFTLVAFIFLAPQSDSLNGAFALIFQYEGVAVMFGFLPAFILLGWLLPKEKDLSEKFPHFHRN